MLFGVGESKVPEPKYERQRSYAQISAMGNLNFVCKQGMRKVSGMY